MTRAPRVSDSATFSAAWRQMLQLRNSASPSFHSLVCRSNVRGVEATLKFATATPLGVNRSSGSAVRLPTTVMIVSPAMGPGLRKSVGSVWGAGSRRLAQLGSDDLGAQHGLVEIELAVQLPDSSRLRLHVDHGVDALDALVDLVGQPT